MSAFTTLGTKIRTAWRRYRWPWHEPGGIANEWNPVTGGDTEYERPEPLHHHHTHGQDDKTPEQIDEDRQAD